MRVVSVREVEAEGLYNPFTPSGRLLVNGVAASCHSRWFADAAFDRLGSAKSARASSKLHCNALNACARVNAMPFFGTAPAAPAAPRPYYIIELHVLFRSTALSTTTQSQQWTQLSRAFVARRRLSASIAACQPSRSCYVSARLCTSSATTSISRRPPLTQTTRGGTPSSTAGLIRPDQAFPAYVAAAARPDAPQMFDALISTTGVINMGFSDKYIVIKHKYLVSPRIGQTGMLRTAAASSSVLAVSRS